jgi:hypothetical protein
MTTKVTRFLCLVSQDSTDIVRYLQQWKRKRYKNATLGARRCLEHFEKMYRQDRWYDSLGYNQNHSDSPSCYLQITSARLRCSLIVDAYILRDDKRHVHPHSWHFQASSLWRCKQWQYCKHCNTPLLRSNIKVSPGLMAQSLVGVQSVSKKLLPAPQQE